MLCTRQVDVVIIWRRLLWFVSIVLDLLNAGRKPNAESFLSIAPLVARDDVFLHMHSFSMDTVIRSSSGFSLSKQLESRKQELFKLLQRNVELIVEVDRNKKGWIVTSVIEIC